MNRRPKNVTIDNVAIRRRIEGFHNTELNIAERRRAIRILHRRGLLDTQIARTLGYHPDAVAGVRRRMGLPSNLVSSTAVTA